MGSTWVDTLDLYFIHFMQLMQGVYPLSSSQDGPPRTTDVTDYFYGTVTVGERGQVVIPAALRRRVDLNPGDQLMVLRHPLLPGIVLTKIDAFAEVLERHISVLEQARLAPTAVDDTDGDADLLRKG